MLAAILLLLHLGTASPTMHFTAYQPASISQHEQHVRHADHLRHLHRLHVLHVGRNARLASAPTVLSPQLPALVSALPHGNLSCSGLETLWRDAGGSSAAEFVAAEIAMAESGGAQYATGQAGERGYWQIHPDHGSLSSYDPITNARAAVIISDDGRSWSAWTTYTSGAYRGRC